MNDPLDFKVIATKGRDAQENALFYPPKQTFHQPNSQGKQLECLCETLDENNSIIEHLHQFLMPRFANHNKLANLHLEYVKCATFLTTYLKKKPLKLQGAQLINRTADVSTNTIFTWTPK